MRKRTIKTDARELAQKVSCMANDNEMLRFKLQYERNRREELEEIVDSLLEMEKITLDDIPKWTSKEIKELQDDASFWEMKCREAYEVLRLEDKD